jgi:hypothetical protein
MDDRPMNEYEAALFGGLMIVIRAIAHGKIGTLAADLREAGKEDTEQGFKNAGATLEILAQIAEADTYYTIPRPHRPPFTVIQGGKDDPENSN